MNKTLKVMTSAALLAGVVAPVAVTTVDAANSKNYVEKVLYVKDDYKAASNAGDTSLFIKADDVDFSTGDTFRLTLPADVNWLQDTSAGHTGVGFYDGQTLAGYKVVTVNDTDLELEITTGGDQIIEIPMLVEVDGAEGELKVTVDPRQSTISGGQYVFATVGEGATSASIAEVKTIEDGGEIATIRIDELSIGAIESSTTQDITLTLPSDFEWAGTPTVKVSGGLTSSLIVDDTPAVGDKKLTIQLKPYTSPSRPGTIYIQGLKIDADKDADFGEIEVDIDGDEVSSQTLVVAEYGDYGTNAGLEDDVPTLLAGRGNNDADDLKTVEVEIKESIPGSWLGNRDVLVEFPSWVKVLGVDVTEAKGFGSSTADDVADLINDEIEGDSNEVEFTMPSVNDGKKSIKAKFFISTEADAEGDVTVEVSGRAGVEVPETVVAKVVSPVTVEVTKADVRTGIKNQKLNDIVITEAVKGALTEKQEVRVWLSDGEFTNEPTIEVVEGNVDIDEDSVKVKDGVLTFQIDGESTRASKIKLSGLAMDLNRAIAEGDIDVKVGGYALVQNAHEDYSDTDVVAFDSVFTNGVEKFGDKTYSTFALDSAVDVGEFDKNYVAKAAIATVVTPAEGNVSAEAVTLTIGSSTMKVGDKEVALDAAPFIEASTGRTYLPLRAIANAIGASSVEWDNATRTATVVKGGLVAQMTIGQNQYVLNGAKIGMDGKAQIVSERTFLPIRALGNALGATVEWDAATQTVTIK